MTLKLAVELLLSHMLCMLTILWCPVEQIKKNATAISKCIEGYGSWSGQQVNFDKSSILFSTNLDGCLKVDIKNTMGSKKMGESYLFREHSGLETAEEEIFWETKGNDC